MIKSLNEWINVCLNEWMTERMNEWNTKIIQVGYCYHEYVLLKVKPGHVVANTQTNLTRLNPTL